MGAIIGPEDLHLTDSFFVDGLRNGDVGVYTPTAGDRLVVRRFWIVFRTSLDALSCASCGKRSPCAILVILFEWGLGLDVDAWCTKLLLHCLLQLRLLTISEFLFFKNCLDRLYSKIAVASHDLRPQDFGCQLAIHVPSTFCSNLCIGGFRLPLEQAIFFCKLKAVFLQFRDSCIQAGLRIG